MIHDAATTALALVGTCRQYQLLSEKASDPIHKRAMETTIAGSLRTQERFAHAHMANVSGNMISNRFPHRPSNVVVEAQQHVWWHCPDWHGDRQPYLQLIEYLDTSWGLHQRDASPTQPLNRGIMEEEEEATQRHSLRQGLPADEDPGNLPLPCCDSDGAVQLYESDLGNPIAHDTAPLPWLVVFTDGSGLDQANPATRRASYAGSHHKCPGSTLYLLSLLWSCRTTSRPQGS